MFIHNLNPVIINFGFLEIRWYSLAYIVGIFLGFYYAKYLIKKYWDKEKINIQNLDNFLIYLILGIIIGGRFGYILFYNFNYYSHNPIEILFLWLIADEWSGGGGSAAADGEVFFHFAELPVIVDGVFEFAKDFRNEGLDRTHNTEFTMLEIYVAYKDYNWMMDFTERMIERVALDVCGTTEITVGQNKISLKAPFKRITMRDAIIEFTGFDIYGKTEDELVVFSRLKCIGLYNFMDCST